MTHRSSVYSAFRGRAPQLRLAPHADDEDTMIEDRPDPTQWTNPPLFVVGGDLSSFDSLGELLVYIEPWDVDNETSVYDAVGRQVILRPEGISRTRRTVGRGRLVVDAETSGADGSAALVDALRRYLSQLGTDRTSVSAEALDGATLPALVALAHRWSRCN